MKKVVAFTSTRAEYGILFWVLHELHYNSDIDLQLIVSGTHLSPEFGYTTQFIEADPFHIGARVEILLSSDSAVGATKSAGLALIGLAEAFERLRPDLLLLVGDRYEALAAAAAASLAHIPIAHLHGGEETYGAVDNQFRHAITKLSHMHLVASDVFARRLHQMGEDPRHVHIVGAPGIDNVTRLDLLNREQLELALGVELRQAVFVVTYHPVTLSTNSSAGVVESLFDALDAFPEATILFTRSNADVEGRSIAQAIEDYARTREAPTGVFGSLGQLLYLSALRHADAVIGNSSSGLIEAPALGTPTVNIGCRQAGRLRGGSVIDVGESAAEMEDAIRRALDPEFHRMVQEMDSPYGDGHAARRITETIRATDLGELTIKRFHSTERDSDDV